MSAHKHLTFEDRIMIHRGLDNSSSRKSIADIIGKDKSTVCKEVKLHSFSKRHKRFGVSPKGTYDCIHIAECGFNHFCTSSCDRIQAIPCKRRDHTVGVCNGCDLCNSCKLTKRFYDAQLAHKEYLENLHVSREGINLTTSQAKKLGDLIKPYIDNGQSIYAALTDHPEITQCEKTIYNYINQGVFSVNGLINLDLRLKPSRKPTKKVVSKVRKDRAYLKGRTYKCFTEYMDLHPYSSVVEMDTVYNDESKGPFIQTLQFVDYNLMLGIYHTEKTAVAMVDGLKQIKEALGDKEFRHHFQVILTDRGSEFVYANEFEALGCKIFYCDPMQSSQKPHVENNHRLFRYICPKGTDLKQLGLHSQKDLDLLFSHINSYPREVKFGKSPIEEFVFYHPNSEFLIKLGLKKIDSDKIILKPSLLNK